MEENKKLTSFLLILKGIMPGHIFRDVKAYTVDGGSTFCCDYVIDGQTYYRYVPDFLSKNMKEGDVYSVLFLGYRSNNYLIFVFIPNDTKWKEVKFSSASVINTLGITPGQTFEKCKIRSQYVQNIDGKFVGITYAVIDYMGEKLRCRILYQHIPLIRNKNVEMCFFGNDKFEIPVFDLCVKHIEAKVKRVSPDTVEVLQSDGSKILCSYTSACKHFRGLLDAKVDVPLPLNLRPNRVCLNKTLMIKKCKEYYSEEGENFCCRIIGVTPKRYYLLCQDVFGFIDRSVGNTPSLSVGCYCICRLLDCEGKICMLPFEYLGRPCSVI